MGAKELISSPESDICTPSCRLKFPTSLIFYQSFGLFVAGVIVLVGYMDRKTLFCSSKDLVKSFYNPTAYCTITGKLSHVCVFCMQSLDTLACACLHR